MRSIDTIREGFAIRVISAIALLALVVAPALAHPGHVADNGAGHDHVAALLALTLALGVAGVAALHAFMRVRGARRQSAQSRRPAAQGTEHLP